MAVDVGELERFQKLYESSVVSTRGLGAPAELVSVGPGHLSAVGDMTTYMRRGGYVPGPAQIALADGLAWLLIVGQLPDNSDTLTTDMAIQFLRAAPLGDLAIDLTLQRMGSRRAVVSAQISSPGIPDGPVSEVTMGFAPMVADPA